MFYETEGNNHGLPHDPFKSCIVPRPIGWITTLGADGTVNLAPYSFFNGIATDPPMVMFASAGEAEKGDKDTLVNCEETGEFVCNMATWDLRREMSHTSAPVAAGVDEMDLAKLASEPSRMVKPPRVKAAPIHLECLYHSTVDLPCRTPGRRNAMVLGRVIGVHIRDDLLTDGMIDMDKLKPIARLGYLDYTRIDSVFTMEWPA